MDCVRSHSPRARTSCYEQEKGTQTSFAERSTSQKCRQGKTGKPKYLATPGPLQKFSWQKKNKQQQINEHGFLFSGGFHKLPKYNSTELVSHVFSNTATVELNETLDPAGVKYLGLLQHQLLLC